MPLQTAELTDPAQQTPPRLSRRRRIIKRLAILFVIALALWLLSSAIVTWKLSHRLKAPFSEPAPTVAQGAIEETRLTTSDRQSLGAWWLAGNSDRPAILVVHGIRSSRTSMLPLMQSIASDGYGVLAITLRANGDSSGEINDVGWSARHDIVAGVEFLERRAAGRRIFVYGTSMGAAAAVYASSELGTRIAGYVLDCPYRDLKTAVWNRTNLYLPRGFNYLAYAGLRLWTPVFFTANIDELSPLERIRDVPSQTPILIFAGGSDQRAKVGECQDICAAAGAHARLVIVPDADHGEPFARDREGYLRELRGFFDRR